MYVTIRNTSASSLVDKIAATLADVSDGPRHIRPDRGEIYSNKGYCVKKARQDNSQYKAVVTEPSRKAVIRITVASSV